MSSEINQLEFGQFRLDPARRLLFQNGKPVSLSPKAFEILLVLVENRGRVVTKDELMGRVWPDSFVEEGNLTQNISLLRKALGERPKEHTYIATVPGCGYQFVAEVRQVEEPEAEPVSNEEPALESEETAVRVQAYEAPRLPAGRPRPSRLTRWTAIVLAVGLVGVLLAELIPQRDPTSPAETGPRVESLAVLPFTTLTVDEDDDHLGLGLADAIITRLARLKRIRVLPTSAVSDFAGTRRDPVAVGRALGAEAVLDGAIQRVGDRIRLTVQLVASGDGRHLWTETFEERGTDIFALQDRISERLVGALALELTGEEQQLLTKRYTENAEAYDLYLKGRYHWNKRTREGLEKGVAYFQRATALDPQFALAYVGLADSYFLLADYSGSPPAEVYLEARDNLVTALQLDGSLVEARASLAYIDMRLWDWPAAGEEFERAIALDPQYATVRHWHSIYLELMGRHEEAVAEARRARVLDPLSLIINESLGVRLHHARRTEEAITQLREALDLDPDFVNANLSLGHALAHAGRFDEALEAFERARRVEDGPWVDAGVGVVYAKSGRRDEAAAIARSLEDEQARSYVPAVEIARIYAALGDADRALPLLERACRERDTSLVFVAVDPHWDALRDDQRFLRVLECMRLTRTPRGA